MYHYIEILGTEYLVDFNYTITCEGYEARTND